MESKNLGRCDATWQTSFTQNESLSGSTPLTGTKMCRVCKVPKDVKCFAKKGKWRATICGHCRRIYAAQHYRNNKQAYLRRSKLRNPQQRKRIREFIVSYKSNKPCSDCSRVYPHYIMDFDHVDPRSKKRSVAKFSGTCCSLERVKEEIEKCELVCANCHRQRTWDRMTKGNFVVDSRQGIE